MARTLDFTKQGSQLQVTETIDGTAKPIACYVLQPVKYSFDQAGTTLNVLIGTAVSYTCLLSELRVAGAGSAPVSVAAALTALSEVFPNAGGSASTTYLVYTALLTQSGTDAPVATVLENTLGGMVVWTRTDVGFYLGTLAGVFTSNKVWAAVSQRNDASELNLSNAAAYSYNANTITVTTATDGSYVDDVLFNNSIEIRVYLS